MGKDKYEKYYNEETKELVKKTKKDLEWIRDFLGKDYFEKPLYKQRGLKYRPINEYDKKALKNTYDSIDDLGLRETTPIYALVNLSNAIDDGKEYTFDQNDLKQQCYNK